MCLAGVGTTLLDIPSLVFHSDVTELCGIHPAGLRTLLAVPRLRILPLPSSLTVQVTPSLLLLSLMPAMEKRQSQQQGARRDQGWDPWEDWASSAESCSTQHPLSPALSPHRPLAVLKSSSTTGPAEWWEHTVVILNSPESVSMDCWLLLPSRKRTKRETLLPGLQVHLEGQPKLAMR